MEKVTETQKCFMNFEAPASLERKARIKAAELGVSRSKLLRLALTDFLAKMEAQPAPRQEVSREPGRN